MRSTILFPMMLAMAAAAPRPVPQLTDWDHYDDDVTDIGPTGPTVGAVTEVIPWSPKAAVASAVADIVADPLTSEDATAGYTSRRKKRSSINVNDPCAPQPSGSGPVSSPDTVAAFLANPAYGNMANSVPVPAGYSLVPGGQNLQGSVTMDGYRGLYTLTTYDPYQCQRLCDAKDDGCAGFNLFYERDPSLNPADGCANPASLVNIKCTLWLMAPTAQSASNTGQYRDQFQVAIAGSNIYAKDALPPAQSGFTGPVSLGGAINAPLDSTGANTYLGYKYYPGNNDVSQCAAACQAQTAYNSRHPDSSTCTYSQCNFFNSYILSVNGVPQGLYCSMYTEAWAPSYATNYGQQRGSNSYEISDSYSYTTSTSPIAPKVSSSSCKVTTTQ